MLTPSKLWAICIWEATELQRIVARPKNGSGSRLNKGILKLICAQKYGIEIIQGNAHWA